MVTIPLSLVGVMSCYWRSVVHQLLTLLALVLPMGLVVDDAIVVVENPCSIEEGMQSFEAAHHGARGSPYRHLMTIRWRPTMHHRVRGRLTAALFREFTFTLAGAVIVSGIVALTCRR